MSTFDTSAFLDATTTEASVKRPPLPVGEYQAVIGDLESRTGVYSKGPKEGQQYIAVDIQLQVSVPGDIQADLGLFEPVLKMKDGFILDTTETGTIDYSPGKNGKLRKYREATGNNVPGQKFKPRMLSGNVVVVKVGHREYPEGSGELFEQVEGVTAI